VRETEWNKSKISSARFVFFFYFFQNKKKFMQQSGMNYEHMRHTQALKNLNLPAKLSLVVPFSVIAASDPSHQDCD
jgi:hypothetical protein